MRWAEIPKKCKDWDNPGYPCWITDGNSLCALAFISLGYGSTDPYIILVSGGAEML